MILKKHLNLQEYQLRKVAGPGPNHHEPRATQRGAFDNGESEDSSAIKDSWCNLESGSLSQSLESDGSKENHIPLQLKSPVSLKCTESINQPLCSKTVMGNTKEHMVKGGFIDPFSIKLRNVVSRGEDRKCDEKKIDMEIEEIQKEITRLSSKLESLLLEKVECNARSIATKKKIVPAKFMEQKQSIKNFERGKGIEDPLFSNIDEGKLTRERDKSLSPSPKSCKTLSKVQSHKPAATTVRFKRAEKKVDGVLATISQKGSSKAEKNCVNDAPKRSLPENDKLESKSHDKRHVFKGELEEESSQSVNKFNYVLPKIRTVRILAENPHDSGPTKRVAELMGKKSYFCMEDEADGSVCQTLSFAEEDGEEI
ncbi:hypothetical protein DITRI_Ditri01bG0114800 [Diplodiscus trichospermus]